MGAVPPGSVVSDGGAALPSAIVVFSHLRWGFVWQRPQHLLSRFAADVPVYFVEEPEFLDDDRPSRLAAAQHGHVTVLTPVLPQQHAEGYGFNETTNPPIARLLSAFFRERLTAAERGRVASWYYTPMALGAEPPGIAPAVVVYDVMDELASFRGAPIEIREREHDLYRRADLVFTGGPSLYEARRCRHPHVHCFPSGVDAAHFAQASRGIARPADIADVAGSIVGFYGVLDERLDAELVAQIADLRPDWTLLMIGPVVKITPEQLPQRPNIRYLGKKEYAELPAYLAAFDAAILPFAINEATRFISPTKTLEYLAAEKPIVSSPIHDVVRLYGDVVEIAADGPRFVEAIEHLWSEHASDRQMRAARARALLAEHAWDAIAARMRELIARRLDRPVVTALPPRVFGYGLQPVAASD